MCRAVNYEVVDCPFISCREEIDYQRGVRDVTLRLRDKTGNVFWSGSEIFYFQPPYDRLFFESQWSFWARNFDFEYRLRSENRNWLVGTVLKASSCRLRVVPNIALRSRYGGIAMSLVLF